MIISLLQKYRWQYFGSPNSLPLFTFLAFSKGRGLLVLGSPGSGKSYFVIRHVITQHIQKGFSMFVYDFKFDDLSRITYNTGSKTRINTKSRRSFM